MKNVTFLNASAFGKLAVIWNGWSSGTGSGLTYRLPVSVHETGETVSGLSVRTSVTWPLDPTLAKTFSVPSVVYVR